MPAEGTGTLALEKQPGVGRRTLDVHGQQWGSQAQPHLRAAGIEETNCDVPSKIIEE